VCSLCGNSLQNCEICTNSTICTNCKGGYYLSGSSQCVQCSLTLVACRLCDLTGSNCTNCQNGYFLSSGSCLLCEA
jgi:hypothetical protein